MKVALAGDNREALAVLSERHTLIEDGRDRSSDYHFVMRCWTRGELESALTQTGFSPFDYVGRKLPVKLTIR